MGQDLTKFASPDEGYASWLFKITAWYGVHTSTFLPDLRYRRDRDDQLAVVDDGAIQKIALKLRVQTSLVQQAVERDLRALQPLESFLFCDGQSGVNERLLDSSPKRYCLTCFKDALGRRQIPVFDPGWSIPWATHCTKDNAPLLSASCFDHAKIDEWSAIHSSQQHGWIAALSQVITSPATVCDRVPLPASSTALSINSLFSVDAVARRAARILDPSVSVNTLRQRVFATFMLLSLQHGSGSIGDELSGTIGRKPCFPKTVYFNADTLHLISDVQLATCLEFLGEFVACPVTRDPFLIREEMKASRVAFAAVSSRFVSALSQDPMLYLAWKVSTMFRSTKRRLVKRMFPAFGEEWDAKHSILASL